MALILFPVAKTLVWLCSEGDHMLMSFELRGDDAVLDTPPGPHIMATTDPLASLEGDMLDVAPGVEKKNGDISAVQHVERLPNVEGQTKASEQTNGAQKEVQECDVLVVGAGFSEYLVVERSVVH